MMTEEQIFIALLIAVNLAGGFGCAIPIARMLSRINGKPGRVFRYFAILVGMYFAECVAFAAGMCTQVFSVALAFLWGVVFGLWLRGKASAARVLKASFFVSLYTSLPTSSFCVVLTAAFLVAGGLFSSKEGKAFGIPDFVPWPLDTVGGFCAALMIGTIVLKAVITTGQVGLLARRRHRR